MDAVLSKFANSIDTPIDQITDFMQTFEGCVQSACFFWETNNLNKWADAHDWLKMTKIINGGTIGLEDRKKHYELTNCCKRMLVFPYILTPKVVQR